MHNKHTKQVKCGNVLIGGGAPITIQSMTNTITSNIEETVNQIHALEEAGCEIVRVAVPDMDSANAISEIKKRISIPLVADIHFDYKLAIAAIENGADKIRINPGNIGSNDKVKAVIDTAKAYNIPIRIGVNSGSLDLKIVRKYGGVTAEGLVESALEYIDLVEKMDFDNIVISIKSSNIQLNHDAHKLLINQTKYPLHIGGTEMGSTTSGRMKSAIGIGSLLLDGIGDTFRVSITGNPVDEIVLAKEILKASGIRKHGVNIVSCPTCGRKRVDLEAISNKIEKALESVDKTVTVSIMGCEVNGPGEAKESDIGIACGKDFVLLFKKGEIVGRTTEEHVVDELLKLIQLF